MTDNPTLERIIILLQSVGFRLQEGIVRIADIPFEFTAILLGPARSLDLVAVVDTLVERDNTIRHKIEGLSRALDVVASRRPLTVILAGPSPTAVTLEALSRVCRVLSVGTSTGEYAERSVTDALAVLLPLDLPQVNESVADPLSELRGRLADSDAREQLSAYIAAARFGSSAVTNVLVDSIAAPLASDDETHV